jgi:hypothetical protein
LFPLFFPSPALFYSVSHPLLFVFSRSATIRFIAGPPYEDIAFKIVNKDWERNPKHGYRCVFDRGVLQLYLNFKRVRYRR